MYDFDEDLVDKAITHYTKLHCFGELDEDFYLEVWYGCYGDPALEACIVMDYIDDVCKPIYDEVIKELSVPFHDRTIGSSDGQYPMGC